MKRVLVIDTSILCVWLKVPGKDDCGPTNDRWDYQRVKEKIDQETSAGTTLVLPLASIIETGNHISHATSKRFDLAKDLAEIMKKAADETSPWAAFSDQAVLWEPDNLKSLAEEWPKLAAERLSLGDATIKDVADYYAQAGYDVETLTGYQGLQKICPHSDERELPRRKQRR